MNHSDVKHLGPDNMVIKRDGSAVPFTEGKIRAALVAAFLKDASGMPLARGKTTLSSAEHDKVESLTAQICASLARQASTGLTIHIETIQDQVELALMRTGDAAIARNYVLYRSRRADERIKANPAVGVGPTAIRVLDQGTMRPFDVSYISNLIGDACATFQGQVNPETILDGTLKNLYDGVPIGDVHKSAILAARALIEKDPAYNTITARLLLHVVRKEIFGLEVAQGDAQAAYEAYFPKYVKQGVKAELLDPVLAEFDLKKLAAALQADRDLQFGYIGLQTLYDRYLLHVGDERIEMPQALFMRVAMGLAIDELDREAKAIEFYHLLSSFDFMSSTPTLFNSGTRRPQLSSCFLTTISDDLDGIYEGIKENALLAKYAGGLGNDWTPVRALGSHIKGTNGKSQGVVPFLKVANDTAIAVNQGGKRKGAVCAYLESWHLDIEEFLTLRKNTGDDRRRTHDMDTANWIPDLFMKRVLAEADWTLFSPSEVPDLHELYGQKFEAAYTAYEAKAARGEIRIWKTVKAVTLWREMLGMLFETGHPWITFKDPCNIRSPQQHVGVVHSSNLCTEITLNTSEDEIAVCNLGSVNLVTHFIEGKLDLPKLQRTVRTAMRMLDNSITSGFYTVNKARASNLRHRPVGLGMMGFQDALHASKIPYASEEAVLIADVTAEALCYYAFLASSELAMERGRYASYRGSHWDLGILPIDSLNILRQDRGGEFLDINGDSFGGFDWNNLRSHIAAHGMRNSNCVAIAPTATIPNIIGVAASIDPSYRQLYVKSNMSGEFTEINPYMVKDLAAAGLWDEVMVSDLKYYDGSLAKIARVPANLKALYATAFEIEPKWLIECAARRQKWIDQGQSLNVYMAEPSGKKLDETYKLAWKRGLKTTYYLRSLGASGTEKATSTAGTHNAVSVDGVAKPTSPQPSQSEQSGAVCLLRPGDEEFAGCEACQ